MLSFHQNFIEIYLNDSNCPLTRTVFLFPFRVHVTGVLLYFVMIGDRFIRSLELFLWFQSAKSFAAQSVNKATVVHESFATCLIIKHNYSCGNFSLIIQHDNIILNQWSAITQSLYIFIIKQVKARGPRRRNKKPIIILYKIVEYSLKNL